jgi:hypothetical protein
MLGDLVPLKDLAVNSLEAARVEICRRLESKGLPTSIDTQRVVVVDRVSRPGESSPRSAD